MGEMAMARGADTRENLVEAGIAEFNEHGFEGTNSNRIARRAGYAPQTFYRHFADKLALFLVVYRQWYDAQIETVTAAPDRLAAARAIAESHRRTRLFRRSLRQLAAGERQVAEARAVSRQVQIDRLARALPGRSPAELAAMLLTIERLADALAEDEFRDLGIGEEQALHLLARVIEWIEPR